MEKSIILKIEDIDNNIVSKVYKRLINNVNHSIYRSALPIIVELRELSIGKELKEFNA